MKKEGIFNEPLLRLMGSMGHTDTLVVCDAGLPIPKGVEKIDLGVVRGVPGFFDVLKPLFQELVVEKVTIAAEIKTKNAAMYQEILKLTDGIPIEEVGHEEFKKKTAGVKAIIRTGECTPYANFILQTGVNF